jgi:predicted GIY-YIG superfamily endonuclease
MDRPPDITEKVIKIMLRERKIGFIESENPGWDDLSADW